MTIKNKQAKRSWSMTWLCVIIALISIVGIYSLITSSVKGDSFSHYGILMVFFFGGTFLTAVAGIYYGSKAKIYRAFSWVIDTLIP